VAVGQDGLAELQFGDDAGFADDVFQALPHADLVDIGGDRTVLADKRAVAQGCRHDRAVQFDRRLQQRRQEAPQPAAVAGGALREHRHPGATLHQAAHFGVDARGIGTTAAFDEQGAGLAGKPARHRPRAHFRLGDEVHPLGGENQIDVQPRHVVAHQERASRQSGGSTRVELHAQHPEQAPGPAHDEAVASRGACQREQDARKRHPPDEVQQQQADPDEAAEGNRQMGCTHGRIVRRPVRPSQRVCR